jgi:broad specificity phosphatase PhoE
MSRLFLIRHAEPAAGWGGNEADPGLTDLGRQQAAEAAEALWGLGPLDIVCSPMRRCCETAAPYAERRSAQPRIDDRISEVVAPAVITDRPAWLHANFPWADGVPRRRWDDVAQGLQLWRDDAVNAMRELTRDSVVFTHFIAANAIVSAVTESEETIVYRPAHASITELELDQDVLRLVRLGAEMHSEDVR